MTRKNDAKFRMELIVKFATTFTRIMKGELQPALRQQNKDKAELLDMVLMPDSEILDFEDRKN